MKNINTTTLIKWIPLVIGALMVARGFAGHTQWLSTLGALFVGLSLGLILAIAAYEKKD